MKSFVVIGCGSFGRSVATNLHELGNEVMVIDKDEDLINDIAPYVTHAVQADVLDENVLRDLGLSNFDVAVIGVGSELEASVMATLAAKELGINKVISKAQSNIHSRILKKLGADKIIFPEHDIGRRLAHTLNSSNILDVIEFSPKYNILEMKAINKWIGKSLQEIDLRKKYSVTAVAIRKDKELDVSPSSSYVLEKGDILVIIGDVGDVENLERAMGEDE